MKKFLNAIVLFAFVFLVMFGCSDQSQSPVAPTEQSSLDKVTITNYICTNFPIGFTGEGEVRFIPGGRWQLKNYGVIEQHSSSDPLANGVMVHYLNLTIDAVTGEGPCHGHWTMTPADNAAEGGIWEGTYQGYRSKSSVPGEWTLPLNIVGHGRGGIIDGMQIFSTSVLTVRADGPTTLPTEWFGVGEGFYKSH